MVDTVDLIIIGFGVLFCIGLSVFFILEAKAYNKRVRVKHLTGSKFIIYDDKAKLKNDNEKKYWYLLKHKTALSIPDSDCLDIDKRGREHSTVYTDGTNWVWAKDNTNREDLKAFFVENKIVPFDSVSRDFLVNRTIEAVKYGRNSFFKQNAGVLMTGTFLLIAMLIVFSFWGEVFNPMIEAGESFEKSASVMSEALNYFTGEFGSTQNITNVQISNTGGKS